MSKKSFIICASGIACKYSFEDEKTHEKKEGFTYYACIQTLVDDVPVKIKLHKTSPDFATLAPSGSACGVLLFDQYGRLVDVR